MLKKTACALAVLATTSTAVMAESIDVKIIGTITPTACKPSIAGGGTIDYGNIHPNTLNADKITVLDEKQVDFSIVCDSPAKIALKATSGRGQSAVMTDGKLAEVASIKGIFGITEYTAGLGLDGNKGIGGYGLRIAKDTVTADGVAATGIEKLNIDSKWTKAASGSVYGQYGGRTISWSVDDKLEPVAFKTLAGKLGAQAYINKTSELDLSKPVKLDGLTTLELIYL
ncbi:TPA: DUF1120 domain-containing protein [Serratia marcescens]|uniref:DUF1120 domain-containing protein n=1 Tax=Serratia nevei TaxID=2703794 RepID=UPI0011F33DAF|nr:DUF1120 domain-containing protein [Serratia nevei]HEJ7857786.1 DUF1120 domain-containing protein [Serratia marcescens]